MVVTRGPHQRGFAKPALGGVRIGARFQQQLQRLRFSRARGSHENGLAFAGRGIRIGARLQQQFHHGRAAVDGGQRERRDAIAIRRAYLRACGQQSTYQANIILLDRPVQGGRAIRFRGMSRRSLLQQLHRCCGVARVNNLSEASVALGGHARGERHHREPRRCATGWWSENFLGPPPRLRGFGGFAMFS